MGNSAGAEFEVRIPQLTYHPGEVIKGTVHLKVPQAVQAKAVYLLFEGSETCRWPEDDFESSVQLCHDAVCLAGFEDQQLKAGEYNYLFTYPLPESLPQSLSLAFAGEIKYRLSAYLEEAWTSLSAPKLHIWINRPVSVQHISKTHEVTNEMTLWKCLRRGTVYAEFTLEKHIYREGEVATVSLRIDNSQSRIDVAGGRISLLRKVTHVAESFRRSMEYQVKTTRVVSRVKAGREFTAADYLELQVQISDPQGSLGKACSASGRSLKCKYLLRVEVLMKTACCGGLGPSTDFHILVYQ